MRFSMTDLMTDYNSRCVILPFDFMPAGHYGRCLTHTTNQLNNHSLQNLRFLRLTCACKSMNNVVRIHKILKDTYTE